jgi:predicted nuclease of predicted toxin-antitoxin system
MKILLDECVPKKLKSYLSDHEVWTVPQSGWAGKKNGALLALAVKEFPVLITVDKDLPYQQNIRGWSIMVVVLATENNDISSLLSLLPKPLEVLAQPRFGEFILLSDSATCAERDKRRPSR